MKNGGRDMSKQFVRLVLVVVFVSMLLTACQPRTTTGVTTAVPATTGAATTTVAGTTTAAGATTVAGTTTTAQTTTAATTGTTAQATTSSAAATTAATTTAKPDEPITISVGIRTFPERAPEPKDLWQWQKYETMTQVKIDWVAVSEAQIAEQKGVMIASGDYPDAFYGYWGFTNNDIVKYGSEGTFVALNPLMEKEGRNLNTMFSAHPDWKAAMTTPDGNIYSLPWIDESILPSSLRYYINKKWLDKVGLEVPETLDEYTQALRKFKSDDANGNGNANDEIPFVLPGGLGFIGLWENCLVGSFGMGDGGLPAIQQSVYIDKTGELQTTINDDNMKSVWKYMKLYIDEGLMPAEVVSGIEYAKWVDYGKQDLVGAFTFVHPAFLSGGPEQESFVGINVLTGPSGDRVMSYVDHPIRGTASFMITDKNKYPERTMKWIDYAYGEEGRYFFRFGTLGETYNMVDGKPQFVKEIRDAETGDGLGVFQKLYSWYGGFAPGWEPDNELVMRALLEPGEAYEDMFNVSAEDANKWKPAHFLPRFFLSPEQSTKTTAILTDVNKYLSEAKSKFILGEWDLDGADWDKYKSDLDRMGFADYRNIMRDAFKSYQSSLNQ